MEKFVKEKFTENVFDKIINRYGFKKESVKKLNSFQSFVYECSHKEKKYIIRITHSSHRTKKQIESELDWINFLDQNGILVSKAINIERMNLIETINLDDSFFYTVVFEKAKGRPISKNDFCPTFFKNWGRVVGKMHFLSKIYSFKFDRPFWYQEDNYNIDKFLPPDQLIVREKYGIILKKLESLPHLKNSFDLIHADLNSTNLFVNNDKIIIFDFDGCIYSWFIHDIAIIIFHTLQFTDFLYDEQTFLEYFLKYFLLGYREENILDKFWFEYLFDFIKLEEIGEYLLIYRSFNLNNLDKKNNKFIHERINKIKNDIYFNNINKNIFFQIIDDL